MIKKDRQRHANLRKWTSQNDCVVDVNLKMIELNNTIDSSKSQKNLNNDDELYLEYFLRARNVIMMSYIWSILHVPEAQVCMIYISEQSATQQ